MAKNFSFIDLFSSRFNKIKMHVGFSFDLIDLISKFFSLGFADAQSDGRRLVKSTIESFFNEKIRRFFQSFRTDFTEVHIKQLDESADAESMNKFDVFSSSIVSLCSFSYRIFLKIFQWEPNKKRTIVLCDLFYYAFVFARNNKFNPEQISTFLSIIKRVHDACIRK